MWKNFWRFPWHIFEKLAKILIVKRSLKRSRFLQSRSLTWRSRSSCDLFGKLRSLIAIRSCKNDRRSRSPIFWSLIAHALIISYLLFQKFPFKWSWNHFIKFDPNRDRSHSRLFLIGIDPKQDQCRSIEPLCWVLSSRYQPRFTCSLVS